MALVFYRGDTDPAFAVQIKNKRDGSVVSLTGATVTFSMRATRSAPGKSAKVNNGSCTVTDAANGKCEFRWGSSDLSEPGTYTAEFKVTKSNGKIQRVQIEDVEVRARVGSS